MPLLPAAGAELLPAMPAALLQQLPEAAQTGLALALARHGPPPPPTETAPRLARDPQVRPPEEGEGGTTGASADHNRSRSSRGADD